MESVTGIFRKLWKLVKLFLLLQFCRFLPFILTNWLYTYRLRGQFRLLVFVVLLLLFIIISLHTSYRDYELLEVSEQPLRWIDVIVTLFFFLAARLLIFGGNYLNHLLNGQSMTEQMKRYVAESNDLAQKFFAAALLFAVIIGLVVPIIEEIIFRGFANRYFFKKNQQLLSAVLTSLLFTLSRFTLNWVELLTQFLLCLTFYTAYTRRENIRNAMTVHVLSNLPEAIFLFVTAVKIQFGLQ